MILILINSNNNNNNNSDNNNNIVTVQTWSYRKRNWPTKLLTEVSVIFSSQKVLPIHSFQFSAHLFQNNQSEASMILHFVKVYEKTKDCQWRYLIGQKWLNFGEVTKIMSDQNLVWLNVLDKFGPNLDFQNKQIFSLMLSQNLFPGIRN